MTRFNLIFWLCSSLLILTGCSQHSPQTTINRDLQRINVSSIKMIEGELDKANAFAWQQDLLLIGDAAEHYRPNMPALRNKIEQHIKHAGYNFVHQPSQAQYLLVALVLVEGHQQSPEHQALLDGLDPGLHARNQFGLGTMLVGIHDRKQDKLLWRGAAQLLISDESIEPAFRQHRIDHAISLLFSGIL